MEYPRFRLKIILTLVIVVTIGIVIQNAFQQYAVGLLYGMADMKEIITLLLKGLVTNVYPPVIIMGTIIYLYINPLHKVVLDISNGNKPSENQYYRARQILIKFPWLILGLNIGGFLIGNLITRLNRLESLLSFNEAAALLQQLSTGALYGFIIINITNIILTKPRTMLKIYYFDKEHKEKDLTLKQKNIILGLSLSLYLVLSSLIHSGYVLEEQSSYTYMMESILLGEKTIEEVSEEFKVSVIDNPFILINDKDIYLPLERGERLNIQSQKIQIVTFLFLTAIAFFVQYTSWNVQEKQLKQLKKRIREIVNNEGELTDRLEITQFDEIGELTDNTNRLMDKFTEHYRYEQDLKISKEVAEIASRSKSAFLANMSHELRTPLNSVIASSDILLEKYFGDLTEKQNEYLNDIKDSGFHLLSLINDILDLSKIKSGHSPLEVESFDLALLLQNSLTIVKEKAFKHGIELSCTIDDNFPQSINADERKIKQIVFNLLSNAVKFTPDGGTVSISGKKSNQSVQIDVTDSGIGISSKDIEIIFGEFAQAEETLTKRFEGTGLGLSLVKRFVEQHDGKVWVNSTLNKGSCFSFTLPLNHEKKELS